MPVLSEQGAAGTHFACHYKGASVRGEVPQRDPQLALRTDLPASEYAEGPAHALAGACPLQAIVLRMLHSERS